MNPNTAEMKKLCPATVVGGLFLLLLVSCSEDSNPEENTSTVDEQLMETDDTEGPSENENPDGNDDSAENNDSEEGNTESGDMSAIELTANPDILTNNGEGIQSWGEGVSLRAIKIDGTPGRLIYDTQFRDKGFGVAGARWDQIDYYVMFQGEEVNASEKIEIVFSIEVSHLVITVGMMGSDEGHPDGETGKWIAYDKNQNQVAEGILGANESNLGPDVKSVNNSYGTYPIALDIQMPIRSLVIEATGFGYGAGNPKNVNSYDNESGNQENNSDFNLVGISFQKEG